MKATSQNNLQHSELFAPQIFLSAAIDRMAGAESAERGAVFTRREVVNFMLDLAGYTADRPLFQCRLLEPSFGSGDFLLAALDRLLESWRHHTASLDDLENAIHGVELHRSSFLSTRDRLMHRLLDAGIAEDDATRLTNLWLTQGDFLLEAVSGDFDFVIGNPPYVRQESIPASLLAAYRQRYVTLYDRADLYVPFIERSLSLLKTGGSLIFICSDRWMKNRYGGPLREMVTHGYGLKYYVDMVGTAAFQSEVIAYPAITVITRQQQRQTRIAHQPEISAVVLAHLCQEMTGPREKLNGCVTEITAPARGDAPWLLEADAQSTLSLVRRLEAEFPTLEEAGCKVGIGVATGADKVFIGLMSELDVEEARKLPLAMTRDILDGTVCWRGLGVVNPFEEDGSLADFAAYPKFAAFMKQHAGLLKARHCAQKNVDGWYRTIDRITPALARTPKLLIPDIKGVAHIVHEEGRLYPHHNLYHIISASWPLPELRCVLMAGIAHLFVRAYSTKMHGGSLRFQAQYLRRIRLPHWHDVPAKDRKALAAATISHDQQAIRAIVARLYAMTDEEQAQLFA